MAVLLPLALAVAGDARAQDAPTPEELPPEVIELPPVTVTARKREEAVEDVPISMTVLDEDRLDIPPTASNAGLARSAPNVSFVDIGGQSANHLNVRGVGSFAPLAADDTSAVIYVGEAPQSVYGIAPSLLDVERVEILRGPQGTLFGRNTQAGAISIVPREPIFENDYAVSGEIGGSGHGLGEAIANAPLVADRLAGRLALRYSSFNGDIPNVVAGGDDGDVDVAAGRGTLLFTPSDRSSALLTFTYTHQEDTAPRFLLRDAADFPQSAVDPQTEVEGDVYGVNFKLEHDFGPAVLQSITSVQRNTSSQLLDQTDSLVFADLTGLPPPFFGVSGVDNAFIDIGETTYLQEIRLAAPRESEIAWTAGANFFRSELALDRSAGAAVAAFQRLNGIQDNDFTTDSYAAFGEMTVPVVGGLKATLGLRATHEEKDAQYRFDGNGLPVVVASYVQDGRVTDGFLTGRTALSYDWSPGLTTYASIARGYVTGGFPATSANNPLGQDEPEFPASTSWTYELGFKSRWLDERVSVAGAVFFNDVRQGHLLVFDGATFTTAVLDYRSYGGELEASARVLPDLELFAGLGFTETELVDVPAGSLTGARSGNEVPNVPAVTGNVGAQYRLPAELLGLDGDILARATYQYVDDRAADVANSFDLRAYGIVNAKLGWEGDAVEIYGFGNNLFDERYEAFGQSFGPTTQSVRAGQGRIVGIGATVRF